eukprot:CAMPEP_0197828218 /NCGR_PEP_ID=MMETSP1437-20131217/4850_1 /TAXON_ID=49252 ORGANISM="Eucampia antarctica, Strain CCMP1452" /NCGR_SAMPLE_ID=MMETSP1437 /ASSEMBLY_ACC=CAM_ASM_001096 /LENGTH=674 /DNA_ID=CAMNT_0043429383 /DNA_START=188 /DNA_END=2212 /DNA_ORIENTATION=-
MHTLGFTAATVLLVAQSMDKNNVNGFMINSSKKKVHSCTKFKFESNHNQYVTAINSASSLEGDIDTVSDKSSLNSGSSSSISSPPDMKAYASGYSSAKELPFSICTASEGSVPADLVGTYYRSGPAMFSAGSLMPPKASIVQPKKPPTADGEDESRMVLHPFDGDGAVLGVTFRGDGTATARFRYVRTNAFTNERRKGMRLYTGMDNTRQQTNDIGQSNDFPLPMYRHHFQSGLNKKRKNTSNTRIIYWSKKLLTLWEGGLPYKLDALALSTEGRSQLGGVLLESSPFGSKAVYDPKKECILLYSNRQETGKSQLTLYEFNSKFRLVPEGGGQTENELPGFAILSDFTATSNYAIFVQPPVSVNSMQYIMSKDPGKAVKVQNGAALLHMIPRVSSKIGGGMKTVSIPFDGISDSELQFCNAFERDGGNTVVFDAIRSDGTNVSGKKLKWPWAQTVEEFADTCSKKSLWRYTIDVKNGGSVSKECLSDLQTSFAVINPEFSMQPHKFIYTAIGGMSTDVAPPQGIAKFDVSDDTANTNKDVDMWLPEEYEFCGEPMFAPRKTEGDSENKKEDDGYIISILYNGKNKESEVIVFNAESISSGPITRIPLGTSIPHGLHGCFTAAEEACWTEDEIGRRAKLSDKMESRGNMWNEVKSDFSGLGLRLDDFEEYFGDIL